MSSVYIQKPSFYSIENSSAEIYGENTLYNDANRQYSDSSVYYGGVIERGLPPKMQTVLSKIPEMKEIYDYQSF